jgi:Flp pilus assembly pilin Flp
MNKLMNQFRRTVGQTSLVKDERGLSTVEYVIILVLIAAAAVAAWTSLGGTVKEKIKASDDEISKISITGDGNGKAKAKASK